MTLRARYFAILNILECWCEKNSDYVDQGFLGSSWTHFKCRYSFEIGRSTKRERVLEASAKNNLDRDTIEATEKLTQRTGENALRNNWEGVFAAVNTLAPKERTPAVAVHNDGNICLDSEDAFEAWSQHVITTFKAEVLQEEAPMAAPLVKKEFVWKEEYGLPQMPTSLMMKFARFELYVDGSFMEFGTGWGLVVVIVTSDSVYHLWDILAGPVPTNPRDDEYEGAQVGSNNTAELTAQLRGHRYGRLELPWSLPVVVRFDSFFANDVTSGQYNTKSNRMLSGMARGERSTHTAVREKLGGAHVRGHSDNPLNDRVDDAAKLGTKLVRTVSWCLNPKPYHVLFQEFPALQVFF